MLTALSDHSFVQRDTDACSSFCLDSSFSPQNLVSSLRLILEQSQENAGKAQVSRMLMGGLANVQIIRRLRNMPAVGMRQAYYITC